MSQRRQAPGDRRSRTATEPGPAPTVPVDVDYLLDERSRLMAHIKLLTNAPLGQGISARQAIPLLTRHWARATWQARAELIRTCRFILQLPYSPETRDTR